MRRKDAGRNHQDWSVQDAKNKFSELLRSALESGPQTITHRGQPTAILISMQQYRTLRAQKRDLVAFFQESPLRGVDLDLSRDPDPGRDVDL